ncbi:MAG: hypothetical protein K2Q20_09280, partial [Phycisphaerales bacterium]|nr:hypothetical protein [Phycisphaerales bacterium]
MQQDTTGGSDLTVQTFLQHPGPHSVPWRDVLAMLRHLPDTTVVEEHNGHLKVRRHDKALVLHRPHGKDLADKDDLARIREFIEDSSAPAAATPGVGTHLL